MSVREGSTVWADQRRRLTLGKLIKSGGAGSVYLLREDPTAVAKIYHAEVDHALYERKIAAMLGLTPELPDLSDGARSYVQIAWPSSLLRDGGGGFLGFLMPALDVAATSELELILMERQARSAGLPTHLGARVTLAANLSAVIAELHRQHHYVVDLKPVNLRFYRQSLYMAMLDCDGFSIQGKGERFHAPQFTIDYLAPEFQKHGIGRASEEPQDRFALAVIVFQLLNFGIHPYSGRPGSERVPTDLPGRIAGHWYPYGLQRNAGIAPNPGSGHAAMPHELRAMFDRAFGKHAALRPSAVEWSALLREYATRSQQRLVVCSKRDAHQHFAGQACAACTREALIAGARAQQRAKPRPARRTLATPSPRVPIPRHHAGARGSTGTYFPSPARPAAPRTFWGAVGAWFLNLGVFDQLRIIGVSIFLLILFINWVSDQFHPRKAATLPVAEQEASPREIAETSEEPPQPVSSPEVSNDDPAAPASNASLPLIESARAVGKAGNVAKLNDAVNALWDGSTTASRATNWSRERHASALAAYLSAPEDIAAQRVARTVFERMLADIVDRDPYADPVLFELAWMRFLDGNLASAREGFEQTLRINPVNAEAWYGMGVTAKDDAETIGALAIAEALTQNSSEAETISRRFQLASVAQAGIDTHRHSILRARARRLVLNYRREPVPQEVEWLANRNLSPR
ncbi:MAG TPA: hypothetical protein VJ806_11710 [Luteimonas sp.]|nr:hypothetical protein [Luteimonas sp.]